MIFKQDAIFLRIDGINSSKLSVLIFLKKVGEELDYFRSPSSSDLNNAKLFYAQIEKI